MIVLTGGKTGGHIMPLIALAKEYQSVFYIGANNSLEERLCKEHGIQFQGMNLKKKSIKSILLATIKLKLPEAKAIIATGGYVSFPVLLYGILHHIPIYLLEENVIMGKTNHFFSLFSKKVFLTYKLPKMKKKYEKVGLPILPNQGVKYSYTHLNIDILIIGGSLGSKPLCDLAYILSQKYKICLVAGRYHEEYQNIPNCIVYEYVSDLIYLMKASRLIISRAGASTTYEIFSLNKPCIIVPSMKTSKNHQYLNALYFEKEGCCKLVKENEAKELILQTADQIIMDSQTILNMRINQQRIVQKNSAKKIMECIRRDIE
ncbi:MAG: UDP-N-acetylglucosamine--N-acetylmuramyl-(pentapeptide) pyrophosphoryl-undecaprenol N-acetylglucosamine transferase [Anaeroplasmataceae bacterium]|nr:UDP-N-acetylglucosamine--N-acetylmuramyl-(pentapeptide) pyrophosphoryl-undecaprenol N-acetylglucosamine transferase [Anaeroplasmataceae bacterium]